MIKLYTSARSQYINKLISSISALLRQKNTEYTLQNKQYAYMVSDHDRWVYIFQKDANTFRIEKHQDFTVHVKRKRMNI